MYLFPQKIYIKLRKIILFITFILLQNKIFANIYVGYGFKSGQPSFFPNQPQEIQEEADDVEEQPEVFHI